MSIEKLTDADYNGKGVTGLADTPDILCLRAQGKDEAAETFNRKMAFPTKQESQHMN